MYKALKLKTKDQPIFFSSDLHYNHDKDFTYAKRGYSNVEEMNWNLIKNWNEVVTDDSIIFHLGDLIFNDPTGKETINLFNQLKFKHLYLMPGNHESGIKHLWDYDTSKTLDLNGRLITLLPNYLDLIIDHTLCVLSHYPFAVWRDCHKSSFMIHGHSHANYQLGLERDKTSKILDVGIDQYSKPLDFFQIKAIMDTKGIAKLDHHV